METYNIKDLYKEIGTINNYFNENQETQIARIQKLPIHKYCHYRNNSENGKCNDYFEMASSGVIHLLKTLKKYVSDYDKLAEYTILWLSYKLNRHSKYSETNLNEFYTKYIEKNNDYNKKINDDDGLTYKDIINRKKNLMDMNINEISKHYGPFNILFYLYYIFPDEYPYCSDRLGLAKSFVDQFKVLNNDSKNIEGSLYTQILSTLSNDYKNLKNMYHDYKHCDFLPLSELTPKKIPVDISEKLSAQPTTLSSEATSSSSSILKTVIPGLSTFSVIPAFLGIAYKTIYKKTIKKSKEENET
ncbi:hypothetical protein YYE_03994 [Plasmodium vinckei vinckei]|uniref:PIR protein CIR protein n=1 Tax=Plasmodium vinckei vinckei TaxID=54757 RepID=A0A081IBA3_PLAVN|nr:hypothetical protein YYE_03994 [Plasmodium vinckei vinckei]